MLELLPRATAPLGILGAGVIIAAGRGADYAGLAALVTAVAGALVLVAREFRRPDGRAVQAARAAGQDGADRPPARSDPVVVLAYEVGALRRELEERDARIANLEASLERRRARHD